MAGQSLAKILISGILANPKDSPKTLIFYGAFGTGKTTSARIFARALNCQHPVNNQPCGKCANCLKDINQCSYYREYDASIVGKVDKLRELKDTFYINSSKSYQVVVFDECHLISSVAQGALLKILEETPPRTFFVLCTTDVDRLLPTIRSRSLEVEFLRVPFNDIIDNIKSICKLKNIEMSLSLMESIARKSNGHMRDVHKYIDQYLIVGNDNFTKVFRSAKKPVINYFTSIAHKSSEECCKSIDELLTYPLSEVHEAFYDIVLTLSKSMVMDTELSSLSKLFGSSILKLVRLYIS